MKKLQQGYALLAVAIWLALFVFAAYGWFENIVALIHMNPVMTGMGIARIAGIFMVPLGVILGYVG